MAELYSIVWIYHVFMNLFSDGHVNCFHHWATIKNAVYDDNDINTHVQICTWMYVSFLLGRYLGEEFPVHTIALSLII